MKKINSPEDVAAKRMLMIMPLLEENLDHPQIIERKKKISEQHNISYRTTSRYLKAYENKGFEGLKPSRNYNRESDTLLEDFPQLLEHAIDLRRECPTRSVRDIIRILELEGRIIPGTLNRSTLQRHMQNAGFSKRQMRVYTKKGTASRRFQKPHRCMLFQGGIKYGPYLPVGENGEKKQVYMSAFIDDATRFIVSAKFYDNQRVEIIEDSLRTAIMQYGKPDAIYVDNGKQYRSKWLKGACSKLGIRLLFAKPYHPEGKGKIEAFNRRITSFLAEAALSKPTTLHELNDMLDLWIQNYYHKSPHASLGGTTPEVAFKSDTRALTFLDTQALAYAFLHADSREVDKTGCISFDGGIYEVGVRLIGENVKVLFDPSWRDEVKINHKSSEPFMAKRQVIGNHCGVKTILPEGKNIKDTDSSRLLDGLNKANITGRTNQEVAVVFRKIREVSDHV